MKLGEILKETFPHQTLIAVTSAGCIPYSSELPAIDMLGLNDYYIPRHPPKNFGNGALAHELGDANYVVKRNPDIMIFHVGDDPNFNIGEQMKANKLFSKDYVKVKTKAGELEYTLFFNKYGKNTGIKKNENTLMIPGYFFNASSEDICTFSEYQLIKTMDKGKTYTLSVDPILQGNWTIQRLAGKNIDSKTSIFHRNGQLSIAITPNNKMSLESIILERKQ